MTPSQITGTPGPGEGVQRAAAPREDAAGLNPWGREGGHLGGGLRETDSSRGSGGYLLALDTQAKLGLPCS